MKTAIYARVSTEEQAKEGFSIGAQQDKLKNYIKIMDWELHDVYVDEGISGKNITDRKDINRLIADIMKGKVKNVLVFKIDRLTRNTKDLISLMDLFTEHNCGFNSLTESIDTNTASGRMFVKIIGIFAEFERENLIERITIAYEKKARDGYSNSNKYVPYGYSREKGDRNITINEEEAKIVKEIFNMYLKKHKTFSAIIKELNMRGIKSSSGIKWNIPSISYMLSNPLYIGKVRYSVYDESRYFEAEGKHEAIITQKTFDEVQSKLAKMRRTRRKTPKDVNYYCGTLKCGICGSKMTTHGQYLKDKDGSVIYYGAYKCSGRYKNRESCNSSAISHSKADDAFIDYIHNIKDFVVKNDVDITANEDIQEDTTVLKAGYEATLTKLLIKEQNIMKLYINDDISFGEYNKMLNLIKKDIQAYEDKISELEAIQDINVGLSTEDIIINLKENWDLLTNLEHMQFLQTYIESIYIVNKPIGDKPTKKQVTIKKVEYYAN